MSSEDLRATTWWDSYSSTVRAGKTHRAEILLRSFAPTPGGHDRRRRVFEELEAATGTHRLDGYDVTVIGEEFCLCESCIDTLPGTRLLETLTRLREYDEGTAHSLSFVEREVDSTITGENYRILVPPELCLTVHVDDELEGVFPCSIEGTSFRAEDFLDALTGSAVEPQMSAVDA